MSMLKRGFFLLADLLAAIRAPLRVEKPIFFIGAPRGGTSIAVELFGRHPEVANWSEAGRVWDAQYEDPSVDHAWGAERATARERRRLHTTFSLFRLGKGRPRFVNKHPRNSVRLPFVETVFPDALFVHVIRDGRAVAASIVHEMRTKEARQGLPLGGFCKPPRWRDYVDEEAVSQAALIWRDVTTIVREHFHGRHENYVEIRYDELCADPRAVVGDLWRRAGFRVGEDVILALPERLDLNDHKWRTRLDGQARERLEALLRPSLETLGYD